MLDLNSDITYHDNFFYLIISQFQIDIKKKIVIKAEKEKLNSLYSNIRASARDKDEEYIKTKREFAQDISKRNSANEFIKAFSLYNENEIKTNQILPENLIEKRIIPAIEQQKHFEKKLSTKQFFWKYPLIFKIRYNSMIEKIIECKYPFRDNDKEEFISNLKKVYPQKFGLNFKNNFDQFEKLPTDVVLVRWENIEFANKRLYINYKNEITSIQCEASSMHLEEIKRILFRKSKFGLQINIEKKPFSIVNSTILENVIVFLNVQYKLTNNLLNIPEFEEALSELKRTQKSIISYFPKDNYINFLLDNHCLDYPVIPVLELNNNRDEPSYIFTFRKKEKLFLVWENKSDDRATYIFKTTTLKFSDTCYNLHDFIKAALERKRKGIRDYDKQLSEQGSNMNFSTKIVHHSFDNWRINFLSALN